MAAAQDDEMIEIEEEERVNKDDDDDDDDDGRGASSSSSTSSGGGSKEKRGGLVTTSASDQELHSTGGEETLLEYAKKKRKPKPPLKRRVWRSIRKNRWFILFMGCFALFLVLGGILLWSDVFNWAAWWSLVVLWLTFGLLIKNLWDPAISMLISMTLLIAPGIITAKEAASGFGDSLIISLAALYIVASAIEYTGCLIYLNHYVLGNTKNVRMAIARLMIPTAMVSGFVNNTPLVAMLMPAVERFCKKTGIPPSKLMIPLSYAAIVGNYSIIATSPNLVVIAIAQRLDPTLEFPFFQPGIIGIPIMVSAWIYMISFGPMLLPTRKSPITDYSKNTKEYTLSVTVSKSSPIVGKTIEEAGLRHLEGLFLVELQRNEQLLPAVGSATTIMDGDLLVFAGDIRKIKDLLRIKGIRVNNSENQLVKRVPGRVLVEAIVSAKSPLIGKSIRKSHFRHNYDAAVISVWREGEQLKGKVGDMIVEAGDTLLMVAKPSFVKEHHTVNDADFAWVSMIDDSILHYDKVKMFAAIAIAITLYVLTAMSVVDLMTASLISAMTILVIKCVSYEEAWSCINASVLIVIAASFSTAYSLEKTGVASEWAKNLLDATTFAGEIGILAGTYLATTILTAVLSNVSAAAIMTPVAFSLGGSSSIKALLYVVMHGASADFSTPIGYQTNLMVWGPGGYRFSDYTRVGLPLQILCGIVTVVVSYFAFAQGNFT